MIIVAIVVTTEAHVDKGLHVVQVSLFLLLYILIVFPLVGKVANIFIES